MEREKNLELLLTRYPELEGLREELYRAEALLRASFAAGKKLLVGGNGGSAADSVSRRCWKGPFPPLQSPGTTR